MAGTSTVCLQTVDCPTNNVDQKASSSWLTIGYLIDTFLLDKARCLQQPTATMKRVASAQFLSVFSTVLSWHISISSHNIPLICKVFSCLSKLKEAFTEVAVPYNGFEAECFISCSSHLFISSSVISSPRCNRSGFLDRWGFSCAMTKTTLSRWSTS